jgi:putative intracellular protease/amidase
VICHATCLLLSARRANGDRLVQGRTWTGFANSEEYSGRAAARLIIEALGT